jgi:hypothetical protein
MTKLLNAYRAAPTLRNREKLQTYLKRHPMAVCLASREECEFLVANSFSF